MKITTSDFDKLSLMISEVKGLELASDNYLKGDIPRHRPGMDIKMRFCFDVYAFAYSRSEEHRNFAMSLYKYMNDDHIYTALKKVLSSYIKEM